MAQYIQPSVPDQYHILENFSATTAENVNTTTRVLAINEFLRDLNLTNGLDTFNGILPEILTDDGASVVNLVISNTTDSYLYEGSGDVAPSTDGTHIIMVAIEYTPTEGDPDAYIGLINDISTHHTANEADLIILGFIQVEVSGTGTIFTIDDVRDTQIMDDDYPNSVGLRRENFNVLDSGVLT